MISLNEIENAYNVYSKEIFNYILRSVYDRDSAEDILQDVFIKLLHYSEKKQVHAGNLRALLYSIARSVTIDAARKAAIRKTEAYDISAMPDIHDAHKHDPSDEIINTVNSIIESLCEPDRSIILFRQNGLTYNEITSILKIPERTLKRKTRTIIENIRKKLQNEGFIISSDTNDNSDSFNE
ncbi:MAG TPA: sigma-70 family RNA polymerase sigma factor [Spirochaetota bacterium]|nr:sigma-70 family RNA polymerase sigma factor [Spirochaetota bacterium]HQO39824.1 sigma-70 family RNA polymerase sigma factor [Spirochaetota bacterium]